MSSTQLIMPCHVLTVSQGSEVWIALVGHLGLQEFLIKSQIPEASF
jgi:hypothetical protein